MPHPLNLRRRLTHRFNDGWRDLDTWVDLGSVRALGPRVVHPGNGHDQLATTHQTFVLPKRTTGPQLRRLATALEDTLSGTSCRHEYDCCGCTLHFARVVAKTPRRLTVRVTATRNY
jgi:hypothetical protein